MPSFHIPVATYRVQLNLGFRFADARALVPYLHELGISDLYASPRFQARKGSSHGYEVADPWRVNSELGTEQEFDDLAERLKSYRMGMLLDIVPNHMAASWENPWWRDVLEHGPGSPYAAYFDIDWHPATTKAAYLQENRVLLPVLGDLYGNALVRGELQLRLEESGLLVTYGGERLPLDAKSYGRLLRESASALRESAASELASRLEDLAARCEAMPPRTAREAEALRQRRAASKQVKEELWRLYTRENEARRALDSILLRYNGVCGDERSFDALDRLLGEQAYRLADWRIAAEEINYRRFFDINGLVGLRLEDSRVFEARHAAILDLVRTGKVTGLRVDHVDGLYDPQIYLRRLSAAVREATPAGGGQRLFTVVEKVLSGGEVLPPEWPVNGTTGYDFLNRVNALFLDAEGVSQLETCYAKFVSCSTPFAEITYSRNKLVMERLFAGEVQALGHQLGKLAARDRRARDLRLDELMHALVEVTACLPVYRTYIRGFEVNERDRSLLESTLAVARRRIPEELVSPASFEFLRRVLRLEPPYYAEDQRKDWLRFVMKWQQFTGAVMAKGLEDTAFYVHNSLVSLNDVGGDPLREALPLGLEAFHRFNQQRLVQWPETLNATSTHDAKRGEDVRARINTLSELANRWKRLLARWSRWNHQHRRKVEGMPVPRPAEEVLLYQTMLGAWPFTKAEVRGFEERLQEYMVKAAREAKMHTSWIHPNVAHEEALRGFVRRILKNNGRDRFLPDFLRFQERVASAGALNGLGQALMKIVSPGVPDFYQGTELWDLNLVDPDNRRQVDFERRRRMLEEIKRRHADDPRRLVRELLRKWTDGGIKLFLLWRALGLRREQPQLFHNGRYIPLLASAAASRHVCALIRRHGNRWVLAASPRLMASFGKGLNVSAAPWGKGALLLPRNAPRRWRNSFTGEEVENVVRHGQASLPLACLFRDFPVALLENVAKS
ncbi:MAG TPA: malto-oligosyltrehalose synthase [Terriglobales bacterium]|nr:malto-oligosyltrehalose synthase [Terriglobales bacterium]